MRKTPTCFLLLSGSLLLAGCASQQPTENGYERFMRLAADVEKRGDPTTAKALYERATLQPGAGTDAWLKLGQTRLDTNDPRGAERAFLRALELVPQNPQAMLGLGTAQLREGKIDRAITALTQAAKVTGQASAYNRLGIARILQGQADAAQAAFKQSLSITPDDLDTQCNLALAYVLGGQTQQALAYIHSVGQSPRAQPRHQRNELLVLVLAGHEQDALALPLDEVSPAERQQLLGEARRIKAIGDPSVQAHELGMADSH
jgi:Flp pilus assembly protein TadD